jgi:RNA polymerase sigma-70 factor, ECF subfamily
MTASLDSSAASLDDLALLQQIQGGDAVAFEGLMRQHNQRLFRIARSILKSDHEAEDVVQNAYIALYTNAEQYAGKAPLGAWLARITVNAAISRLRQQNRAMALQFEEEWAQGVQHPPSPEDAASAQQLRELLEKAIDRLLPGLCSVFVLREVEGMNSAEVGSHLGISEGSVRVRLHRAREQLKQHLERHTDAALRSTFAFAGERCNRIVHTVFERLSRGA